MEAKIDIFSLESDAKAFFKESIEDSDTLDGFMIKRAGFFSVYKNEDYKSALDDDAVFFVISYPKGTGFAIDGSTAEVVPAAPPADPSE